MSLDSIYLVSTILPAAVGAACKCLNLNCLGWSRRPGLNWRPADYESAALPLSYVGFFKVKSRHISNLPSSLWTTSQGARPLDSALAQLAGWFRVPRGKRIAKKGGSLPGILRRAV